MSVNQQDSEQVCKVNWVIANHHFTGARETEAAAPPSLAIVCPRLGPSLCLLSEESRIRASPLVVALRPFYKDMVHPMRLVYMRYTRTLFPPLGASERGRGKGGNLRERWGVSAQE